MFVSGQVRLVIGFADARARLAELTRAGWLLSASRDAYGSGWSDLAQSASPGSVRGLPGLVTARSLDLAGSGDSAGLALRWEADGPGGQLFPALDADLTLTADGEQATTLALAAVYRLPPGNPGSGLDPAMAQRVARATIGALLDRIADAITGPARAGESDDGIPGGDGHGRLPPTR